MRRDGWNNKVVPFPAAHKLLDISHPFGIRLVIRNRKIDDRFTKNTAHTSLCSLIGDRVFEVVHVAIGGRTTTNHLRETEPRANAHKLLRHIFRFRRKDVLRQPLLQIEIISESTKQDHRHMRVTIDQPRRNHPAKRLQLFPRRVSTLDLGPWSNRDDASTRDRNSTIVNNATRTVHRHNRPTENQEIDWPAGFYWPLRCALLGGNVR